MSNDWCGPTTELPNHSLARLLHRARRTTVTAAQKRPTDSSAPLTDPWFEDSQPVPAPVVDPGKPVEVERQRKERTQIPKIVTRPPVYPVYRGDPRTTLLMVLLGLVCAAVTALVVF